MSRFSCFSCHSFGNVRIAGKEIGLVKINALDRDIDPFGVIVNRTIIRRLTTGMLALASGVLIFFRQPREQGF